jgi:diguanylate cyclase (GGDEF)-like protein
MLQWSGAVDQLRTPAGRATAGERWHNGVRNSGRTGVRAHTIAAAVAAAAAACAAVIGGAAAARATSPTGLAIVLGVAAVVAAAFVARLARRARAAESLALRDALTGLPNRSLLDDRLEQALHRSRRTMEAFALMVVDLDGFKEVNDIRGHEAGDQVLQDVARRLESVVRASDTVARVGGDEFVVLSLGTGAEEEAAALVGRLRHALRRPYEIDGGVVEMDASIGWAIFPSDGATPEELLGRADTQMFATKHDSGDDSGIARRGSLDAGIVREFETALEQNEVVVHYQPVIDLGSGSVIGVESLVRRRHPERGLLAPAEFVSHVERTPLIRALTLHVVSESIAAARRWSLLAGDLGISVNVPYRSIDDESLAEGIIGLLDSSGFRPSLLTLEVVPAGPGAGAELDREVLERLTRKGIRLSIDDFGRASSLAAIRVLPLAEAKIDSGFVRGLGRGGTDEAIVRNLIALAHDLRLETVAEGVETRAAWDAVATMGCDRAQGYYLQPPLPAEELGTWLETSWPAVALAGA